MRYEAAHGANSRPEKDRDPSVEDFYAGQFMLANDSCFLDYAVAGCLLDHCRIATGPLFDLCWISAGSLLDLLVYRNTGFCSSTRTD